MKPIERYWLSSAGMTIQADVQDGVVIWTAPIAHRFVRQPLENLKLWMRQHPGGVTIACLSQGETKGKTC